jgi:hypothetical protein
MNITLRIPSNIFKIFSPPIKSAKPREYFRKNSAIFSYRVMTEPAEKDGVSNNPLLGGDKPKKITYFSLFKYASSYDMFLVTVGSIFAIVNGTVLPLMTIFFGDIMGFFHLT